MNNKIKTSFIVGFIAVLFSITFLQISFAIETEQVPNPPQIPAPIPEPEPIQMPKSEPTPNPFPVESESEKIQRLIDENNNLKEENYDLQHKISSLTNEKLELQFKISELNDKINSLNEVIMEQVRIMIELTNNFKGILFENIFSPLTNL